MAARKILVVEDEFLVAKYLQFRLPKLGYHVAGVVSSGEAALEKAAEALPDLVLMDINLKGRMDGVEAAGQIRTCFDIPVVYLTACADEQTLNRAGGSEPFGYLLKPFQDKQLQTTIEIALRRHQAEARLRSGLETAEKLRKEAEEISEKKTRHLSIASHELRNPLTTILLSAETLAFNLDRWDDQKKRRYLHFIQGAAENMSQVIEDVLVIGRAEAGKLELKPALLELENFCRNLVEELLLGSSKQHRIIFTRTGTHGAAVMDKQLLRQILMNLLCNAIKYSPTGSTINFTLNYQPSRAVFRIQDAGIGIPPEEMHRLFEPFYRCSNVNSICGNGLGLAIVKKAVELHRGEIAVESEIGAGTTFTVTIPLNGG
ncbi:hybrid sensor histidine kinase/response regulator [Kamptonema formosum]|uniref:hybrid sensor histidine kinase/response regulator n=1 Tax=Kamptonema formosum TaxID=331992 RepID=UPI000347888A|nr:ATP-binding protein [Oscillatoria sp. PCC 10802]